MDDELFDPIDNELRRRFDAAAPGAAGDPDLVLDALRPQMRKARTRHRVVIGGSVLGVLALVAVAGAALTGGTSNPNVNTPPASHSSTPRPTVPDTTVPTTPTTTVDDHGTDGATTPAGGDTSGSSGTSESSGSSGSSGSGTQGGGETTPTAPAAQAQTFSSAGGSITVTLADGSLTLTGTAPAVGQYAQVNKSGGTTVEVEFFSNPEHSGKRTSRIRVDLVHGAMQSSID